MEKIKWAEALKNKHILRLCVILIIGVALLLVGNSGTKKSKTEEISAGMPMQATDEDMEERLAKILSQIKGVGKVDVMLTYDGTGKRSYVKEVSREQTKDGTKMSSAENTSVVTPKDVPVVESEVYPKVRGVIVVAQGAARAEIREQIIHALKALLEVEEHRIGVFAK